MTKNIGSADGIIRMTTATMIGLFFFSGLVNGTFGTVALWLAVVLALSSFFRFCPLYYPLGITTYHSKH